MQRELSHPYSRELSSSRLRRSVYLFRREVRAKVEPDGSSSWVQSAASSRLIFGREAVEVFKVQSGVKIGVRAADYALRATPTSVSLSPRDRENVQAAHSFRLLVGDCVGSVRSVRISNVGDEVAKVRVLTLHDPTSLNYRRERDAPGEIGVNAFNRQDEVVMDDVGDTTGVRVVGFTPRPSVIYMTKDKARAAELLAQGELPESSLGMSGSVILLTQHDLSVPPGGSAEVRSFSVYHPSSLESALNSSALARGDRAAEEAVGVRFASSSPSLNFSFEWAKAALFAIEGEPDRAEGLWSGVALALVRGAYFEKLAESVKRTLRRDGTLPYCDSGPGPVRADRSGPVETSLYLVAFCAYLAARAKDRKLAKRWYPHLRKVADGLAGALKGGLVPSSVESPDGWRRRLRAGFPTGYTAEANLLATRALRDASTVASLAGRGSDSARFRELSVRLRGAVGQRLRDSESGVLALNVDGRGVVHREVTVDQAVGLSYLSLDENLSSSVIHRLLEKDFETGYGPRTVPGSNNLYFSQSYADGQLGGYWTRAALSHALLAYFTGYPGTGSMQLEKIARLVSSDSERLGGVPGEFPYWIDTERRQVAAHGSDPVAAARLVEAVLLGEAGLSLGSFGARFRVPAASQLGWLLLHNLDLGKQGAIFVGRSTGRVFAVSTFEQESAEERSRSALERTARTLLRLPEFESLDSAGLEGAVFWDASSSVVCVGNAGSSPFSGSVSVPLRSKSFSTALFAQVEELQQEGGVWSAVERVKLVNRLELKVELRPGSWRAFRVSRAAR